jgi:hypothetical protein
MVTLPNVCALVSVWFHNANIKHSARKRRIFCIVSGIHDHFPGATIVLSIKILIAAVFLQHEFRQFSMFLEIYEMASSTTKP